MTITLNGTTGITSPSLTSEQGFTSDGISFANNTPANTLVTDTSGNVGVGTASPATKLHVSGSDTYVAGVQSSSAYAYLALKASGSSGTVADPQVGIGANANDLAFRAGGAERMRIDSSGQLVIGTTTALNAGTKLSVYNTTSGGGGAIIGYGSIAGQFRVMYLLQSNGAFYFDSGTNAAYLSSAGAWTNASDARLKNSITDIKYGLDAVLSTKPRSYKMNDLDGDYIGFVAQELQTVIPEVVSGDPEKQLGVDYGSLVSVAFKAIQEQQAMITELKAELDAVKTELATLKG